MRYQAANKVLPQTLLEQIQQYVHGEYLYIPRADGQKKIWGSDTPLRAELQARNEEIYAAHCSGISICTLADRYYLSEQSIRRILTQQRKQASVLGNR